MEEGDVGGHALAHRLLEADLGGPGPLEPERRVVDAELLVFWGLLVQAAPALEVPPLPQPGSAHETWVYGPQKAEVGRVERREADTRVEQKAIAVGEGPPAGVDVRIRDGARADDGVREGLPLGKGVGVVGHVEGEVEVHLVAGEEHVHARGDGQGF